MLIQGLNLSPTNLQRSTFLQPETLRDFDSTVLKVPESESGTTIIR